MVILAVSICTKNGKPIVSRQFVEMTKNRIEGLLMSFPKLIEAGTQHTFVETDSVRYVYQPLEKLFLVLITTKTSNILEDLDTLRLFALVIPEYCKSMDEQEINESAFELIFAFDEIVSFGYRESVNLSQIRTFVEMESHEEKVYLAVRQSQEREAKNQMRERAKELQKMKLESSRKNIPLSSMMSISSSNSNNFIKNTTPTLILNQNFDDVTLSTSKTTSSAQNISKTPKSIMRLSNRNQEIDSFVDKVQLENVKISAVGQKSSVPIHEVKIKIEEKLSIVISREGSIQSFEVHGFVTLHIANEKNGRLRIKLANNDRNNLQLQTHPNVDKELFNEAGLIRLKQATKSFPINTDVGILKWRLQTNNSDLLPLLINCWPSDNGDNSCDIIIEYELKSTRLRLSDVSITIPMPLNSKHTVTSCDGDYLYEARKNQLFWNIENINDKNKTGTLEMTVMKSRPECFFPLNVVFKSDNLFSDITVEDVIHLDDESSLKFDLETETVSEKFEIV